MQTHHGQNEIQTFGLLFLFYQFTNSAILFFFAKCTKTRAKIDFILGPDFIGFHRINAQNKACFQLGAVGLAGYAFAKGDDSLQNAINSADLAAEVAERAKLKLPKMSAERYQM